MTPRIAKGCPSFKAWFTKAVMNCFTGSIPASAPAACKSSPCYKVDSFMSSHLAQRDGIWWARLVVPERLRNAVGRREFSLSTRIHDLGIVKLVASILLVDWRRQLLGLELISMTLDVLNLVPDPHTGWCFCWPKSSALIGFCGKSASPSGT